MTSNDQDLLKSILINMRYVDEPTIDRFLNNYTLGKEVYRKNPDMLLGLMQHMFGPGQGKAAFELFTHLANHSSSSSARSK